MADGVQVDGGRQLRKTLRAAGDDLQDLKAAHTKAARVAADASAALAPVRSGRLAGTVRGAGTKTAGIIRAGRAAVPYAGPIHWGWGRRRIKAQPFMSDGARNSEGQWLPYYMADVDGIISKVQGTTTNNT